jgi:hypothetical protein
MAMGELLGLGLSHYPGPAVPAKFWPRHMPTQVERGRLDREVWENRAAWPEPMRVEWGDDEGQSAARQHQAGLLAGYRRLRRELDEFRPDLVVVWGDDQYENFRKECVPPFCIFIRDDLPSQPVAGNERGAFRTPENAWGLAPDTTVTYQCHKEAANGLTRHLLGEGFDVAYALEMRHPRGLSHSFALALLYLDFDQKGFDYPIVPFHVNCYGNQLMTTSAMTVGESTGELSPPAPSPRRCFEIGRATARYFLASPWRVALIASSSWSHASLTPKHQRLYPDVESDRRRYDELATGRLEEWAKLSIGQVEDAGEHEFLNWVCLAGAMVEAGQAPSHTEFLETYIFNSTKCFAIFPPKREPPVRAPAR